MRQFLILIFMISPLVAIFPTTSFASKAKAILHATEETGALSGEVYFEEVIEGLKITASVNNAPPGRHGFHIHDLGLCGDGGKAAGGHFNPYTKPHGYLPKDGLINSHAGDLGNIKVSEDGVGQLELVIPGLNVFKRTPNIAGRAVIVHALEDDFGQPTGNAGARIACGTILITEN